MTFASAQSPRQRPQNKFSARSHAFLRLRRAEPMLAPRKAAIGFRLRRATSLPSYAPVRYAVLQWYVQSMQKHHVCADVAISIYIHILQLNLRAPARKPTHLWVS